MVGLQSSDLQGQLTVIIIRRRKTKVLMVIISIIVITVRVSILVIIVTVVLVLSKIHMPCLANLATAGIRFSCPL